MKWERHRCQAAPGSTEAMASRRPWWQSLITSCTPDRPRATIDRRNATHPGAVL